jgi:hypothetical protein
LIDTYGSGGAGTLGTQGIVYIYTSNT